MQTTAETTAATATQPTQTPLAAAQITNIRKRLDRWELDHLRQHCTDLAQRLDATLELNDTLQSEASRAWDCADSWRDNAQQLCEDLQAEGKTVGLTMGGELVVMPVAAAAAAAPSGITLATTTPTGQIIPVALGTNCFALGGTLGAIIARRDGSTYGLIVADASHEFTSTWGKTNQDVPGAKGPDGATNTQAMAAAVSPAASTVQAFCLGGHTDWHIPSRLEMLALYEASPELFDKDCWYWTSSQFSRNYSWMQGFEYGYSNLVGKDNEHRVRPVRSIQLQPFAPSTLVAAGDPREILGAEVAA